MLTFTSGLHRAAEWWWPQAWHITWQASALALILLAMVALGRRWPSPLRYWLLVLALAKFATPPLLALPTGFFSQVGPVVTPRSLDDNMELVNASALPTPASARPEPRMPSTIHGHSGAESAVAVAGRLSNSEVTPGMPAGVTSMDFKTWLFLGHLLGSAAAVAWILYQLRLLRRGLGRARLVKTGPVYQGFLDLCGQIGLRRPPRLLLSTEGSGPIAFGILRPAVVLPEVVADLPAAELQVILAHELAHHRRGDLWINWVQIALTVVWWFNPVVWWLNRSIRKVREDCCDDFLLIQNLTTDNAYCNSLLQAASAVAGRAPVGITLGFADRLHPLGRRFHRIMDSTLHRSGGLSLTGILLVFVLAGISLPGLRSVAGDEQPGGPSSKSKTSSEPEQTSVRANDADALLFSGRVLDPDGKPFAGAKLYVTVKSAIHKPLKPKVPENKLYEATEVDGKRMMKAVEPKLRQVFKRFGLDPDKLDQQEMATVPKLRQEIQEVMREFFEEHPFQFPPVRAVSGADGRFRFTIAKAELQAPYHEDVDVLAVAEGYGPGWYWSNKEDTFTDVTVRLARDVPINGRIVDLEGRPVRGATVKMGSVMVGPDGTLQPWIELVKAAAGVPNDTGKFNELLRIMLSKQLLATNLHLFPEAVTTDADGRFRISGIGADRVVFKLQVTGPGIGSDYFSVMTRPGPGVALGANQKPFSPEYRTYGATFEHVVNPTRIITGTVRDQATGQPLAGVQIAAFGPAYVECFSDKDGKYQLVGLPKGKDLDVTAWPWSPRKKPLPYLTTTKRAAEKLGLEPVTVDFDLVRGVVLRGRLTDLVTGKPVRGAMIWYATFKDNPDVAGFGFPGNPAFPDNASALDAPRLMQTHTTSGPDGSFSLIVLPGRGLLGVRVTDGPYRTAELEEANQDRSYWSKTVPYIGTTSEFQALKLIDVPAAVESTTCDLTLDPGKAVTGSVRGPDGKPLAGVSVSGLTTQDFNSTKPLQTADFTVVGLGPKQPRLVVFYHPERKLAKALVVRAEDAGPLSVTLEECGTVTGRLVDADRMPRRNIQLLGHPRDQRLNQMEGRGRDVSATTDKDGRFRIEGMIPGFTYGLRTFESPDGRNGRVLYRELTVQPGETKDLGDVPPLPVR